MKIVNIYHEGRLIDKRALAKIPQRGEIISDYCRCSELRVVDVHDNTFPIDVDVERIDEEN
jgi:hypothetical protein